eukprot:353924-Chlamydomonas_euryale.AAC.6
MHATRLWPSSSMHAPMNGRVHSPCMPTAASWTWFKTWEGTSVQYRRLVAWIGSYSTTSSDSIPTLTNLKIIVPMASSAADLNTLLSSVVLISKPGINYPFPHL